MLGIKLVKYYSWLNLLFVYKYLKTWGGIGEGVTKAQIRQVLERIRKMVEDAGLKVLPVMRTYLYHQFLQE